MSTDVAAPRRSRFRAALARPDAPALGTWVKLPVMESVELLALAGFDFVVVDLEHAPIDLQTAYQLIGTANHLGLAPIVRIPALDPGITQRVLDAGAEGVMVPHVDTVEQARAAVAAVRFPPLGARGVGSTSRAGAWGAMPRAEYLRYGQEEVVLVAQIESARAASSAGAVAAVPGVDALLVGAADLSTSEGTTEDDPRLVAPPAAIRNSRSPAYPSATPWGGTRTVWRWKGFTLPVLEPTTQPARRGGPALAWRQRTVHKR
ncbi:HpcH/HpaI aldolase/citrate lyase family protein [Micromonospora sp. B006]|uniref:HpcH/HpaI aldolase family protein n=1 Tax=Micromonospora sp. B006 TaxID=2201999 RepID=UPI000E3028FB|nr:aldolase/citrate lyase family protein [Micromonospora sp. B006]AXO37274.1 24-dihydroxyhept-2-ene-17-dioic acid aldolase [Micromonospora sp. B006]